MMQAIRGGDLSLPMTRLRKMVGVDRPTRLNSFLPSLALLVSLFFAMEVVTAIPPQEAPEITHISFQTWSSPGMPHILVRLNQPVTPAALRRHLFFSGRRTGKATRHLGTSGRTSGVQGQGLASSARCRDASRHSSSVESQARSLIADGNETKCYPRNCCRVLHLSHSSFFGY